MASVGRPEVEQCEIEVDRKAENEVIDAVEGPEFWIWSWGWMGRDDGRGLYVMRRKLI
jgi:hypothetical protein